MIVNFSAADKLGHDKIEYAILMPNSKDTNWLNAPKPPSLLDLRLEANTQNNLLLRYDFQPQTISNYAINVKPHWWQTSVFKFLGGLAIGLSLVLIPFLFYQKRKKKLIKKQAAEQKQTMLELNAIRSQLNPHFIFNALSSIQGLVNTNNINGANQYLSEFGMLMRNTLTESDKILSRMQIEIDNLNTYLKLEQLRFHFKYKMMVQENINTNDVEIPTLLLQPLIENAVKHGISELQKNGLIHVSFTKNNNDLIVTVTDNGKGFDTFKPSTGYGLKLTTDRIKLLNNMQKNNQINLQLSSSIAGTVATITFYQWL